MFSQRNNPYCELLEILSCKSTKKIVRFIAKKVKIFITFVSNNEIKIFV